MSASAAVAPLPFDAVVLAGGHGTRLREVVAHLPKPMAPVAGRPFLELLLGTLAAKGIGRAVLSLGYMAQTVIDHFGPRFAGIELGYAVEATPLGTGGGLRAALARVQTPHALVVNGDTFLDLDLAALAAFHRERGVPLLVGRSVEDAARYGRLRIAAGRVVGFDEKGAAGPGIINAGHLVLPRTVFDAHALPERFSFEADFLAAEVARQRFDLFVADGTFIDIGVPDDYRRAQTELAPFAAALPPRR